MKGERLVSQSLKPDMSAPPAREAAVGEPMLPSRFCWGKREVEIAVVLSAWRDTGPCSHGSGEQYVRKHWFRVRTSDGEEMQIYFERQPRSRSAAKARWWLYTVSEGE